MKLTISRILHAGYVIKSGDTEIVFDPIFENPFSVNCHAFPNVQFEKEEIQKQKFSAVFISHYHDDHCSMKSLALIDKQTPVYLYCQHEEMFSMLRELGFKSVISLVTDKPVAIGDIIVTPRLALDPDVDSIFQIQVGSFNILNVVDAWIDPTALEKLKKYAPWDLVLWPFQTMREIEVLSPKRAKPPEETLPQEWIDQLKILSPKYLVPSSCQFHMEPWSWYNHAFFPVSYKRFEHEMNQALPNTEVIRLNPSCGIELNGGGIVPAPQLSWVKPVGEQNLDYQFEENVRPQSTAEIAQKLSSLTDTQKNLVLDYCQTTLIKKFQNLEESEDPYFSKSRIWRLSLLESSGNGIDFYYSVKARALKLLDNFEGPLHWTTEIPMAKLYSALEEGEALTSLYIRINDVDFDAKTEVELDSVEIMEDPLVRCLYTGVFGAYQRAQLRR